MSKAMRKPPYLNAPKVGSFYFARRYPSDVAQFFDAPFRKTKLGTRERGSAEKERDRADSRARAGALFP